MKRYDPSRAALYHPEVRPVFTGLDDMPRFEADNLGFSLVNAWWLSNLSHLAYCDAGRVAQELHGAGLRMAGSFSQTSTQAFLAIADAFAVLVFRGTESDDWADLKTDADIRLVPFEGEGRVHRGVLAALDEVWPKIEGTLGEIVARDLPVWYTGHSLGAALATLAAARRRPAALFTFGSPRVGDAVFAQSLEGVCVQRIVNCCDVITTMPPPALGYQHVGVQRFISSAGRLLTDPSAAQALWARTVGTVRYARFLPWLRRGVVPVRSLTDHTIVNYTLALSSASEAGDV